MTLRLGTDFLPASFGPPPRVFDHTPVVYVGSAADTAHAMSSTDIAGKFLVIDVTAGANFRSVLGPFLGRYREAAAIGVVALEQLGSEQIARIRDGRPVADTTRNPRAIAVVWLSRSGAVALLGAQPSTLTPGATVQNTVTGNFDFPRTPVRWQARNVVGILRGSDAALRTEYLSLSAHHDHVGFDH